jgi:hypothetical protein
VAALAAPVLGLVVGIVIVLTSPMADHKMPLWQVWAPLAIALSTVSGVVFSYGLRRWADLRALHQPRLGRVAGPVAAIVIGGIAGIYGGSLILSGRHFALWRGQVLVTIAIVLAVPAAGVMFGVWDAASSTLPSASRSEQVALLIALRRVLERMLAAIGPVVALATLQEGVLIALHASVGSKPTQYILVFGGYGSLLAGLVYVPAWAALRDRGLRLSDELFPMKDLDTGQEVLSRAGDRQKLEQLLGADRNVLADLQTGLAILAPLLASAAVAFLPH